MASHLLLLLATVLCNKVGLMQTVWSYVNSSIVSLEIVGKLLVLPLDC